MGYGDYTLFKGVSKYSDVQLTSELENNLKYWLDWAFLSIGSWTDVSHTGNADAWAGNPSVLKWTLDQSYPVSAGQCKVFQSARKDWVWESGVNYTNTNIYNPINITGVWISGVSYAVTSLGYINYPQGKLVLNNPTGTGVVISGDYSYRNIQVYKADDAPWWKELQYQTFRTDTAVPFSQDPSTGDWSIGKHKRVQLPAIVIEIVPRGISHPYELGNGGLIVEQDVLFHIIADNRQDRNNLTSILQIQQDKVIWLFDTNKISASGAFPLDYRGTRVNHLNYPDLVGETGYRYKKCMIKKTSLSEVESINPLLYEGVVRATLEVILDNIS